MSLFPVDFGWNEIFVHGTPPVLSRAIFVGARRPES
jgi:hypothetical protein